MIDDLDDPNFVAFGDQVSWIVGIDHSHPQFHNAVLEVTAAGSRIVDHHEDFRDAAVAAAERARCAADAARPSALPSQAKAAEWICHWALEEGGVGGLIKTGAGEFAHVEAKQPTDAPVVLEHWQDSVGAVSVILSPE